MATLPAIDCSLCKSPGSLAPTRIFRNGGIVLGLGFLIAGVSAIATISGIWAIVAHVGGWLADFSLLFSLGVVGSLLGWHVAARRAVYKCGVCGFVVERD